jgi:AcrR family transcriptional regulator
MVARHPPASHRGHPPVFSPALGSRGLQECYSDVTVDDAHILHAARQAIERHGWHDATLERIAGEAGLSRMTLHRRGVTRESVLASLARAFEEDYRSAMWPALTAPGSARERLEMALDALCDICDANLELLSALGEATRARIFHEPGEAVLTRSVFTEPVERLLRDGIADGSLKPSDPAETATVLYNLVNHTYRHLRRSHGWPPQRAREGVLSLALEGIAA